MTSKLRAPGRSIPRTRRQRKLAPRDRVVVTAMVVIPALFVIGLVWLPAISSVLLSFTSWNGIGSLDKIKVVGVKNYVDIGTIYPPSCPAVHHPIICLVVRLLGPTLLGLFLAVLLDKEVRGTRIYQPVLHMPL